MLINAFILTSLCKVYFLQLPKELGIITCIMHQSIPSVNHSTDNPGAFDQNFCLGQRSVIYDIHIFSVDKYTNFLLLSPGALNSNKVYTFSPFSTP